MVAFFHLVIVLISREGLTKATWLPSGFTAHKFDNLLFWQRSFVDLHFIHYEILCYSGSIFSCCYIIFVVLFLLITGYYERVSVLDFESPPIPVCINPSIHVSIFYLQVDYPVVQWFSLQEATGGSAVQENPDWAALVLCEEGEAEGWDDEGLEQEVDEEEDRGVDWVWRRWTEKKTNIRLALMNFWRSNYVVEKV